MYTADVDGDGDMDMLLSNGSSTTTNQTILLYENGYCSGGCNGNGQCSLSTYPSTCSCDVGFMGTHCDKCKYGFYGAGCNVCPGGGEWLNEIAPAGGGV